MIGAAMLMACSMASAQVIKVMKGETVVEVYPADQADRIVFEETPFGQGYAKATGIGNVKWIQLWADGPKWAECNVGAEDKKAEEYGGYFAWADNTEPTPWGSNWRMPASAELEGLLSSTNCTVEFATQNGVNGLLCTGKGAFESNSIFLPAAGTCENGHPVTGQGEYGFYWSSTPIDDEYDDKHALFLQFYWESVREVNFNNRAHGCSARVVLNESE